MRATVFTDGSLARQAGRFVWLSIDVEKEKNAAFRKTYGVGALPSFFVLDEKSEAAVLRWVGGATVAQLTKLFDDGERAARGHGQGVDELLHSADALYGAGRYADAAKAYTEVVEKAPKSWGPYGRAMESLLFALQTTHAGLECARRARDAYPALKATASAVNVAAFGLGCALGIPAGEADRAEFVSALEADTREVLGNRSLKMTADDRSGLYEVLADARQDAKDAAGAKKAASEWAAFLEGEAGKARTPDERAVYDSHRLSAYLALGEPERAIPMLEASERALPGDYNPPARLAVAYRALKRYDEALAASDRALAKAYGPRRILILRTRSDIYLGKGDAKAAERTLNEAVAFAEALPDGQRSQETIAALKKQLEALKAKEPAGS
jgi:tetratricopeptide repeat protein